jgi:hypothetical protein
VRLEDDHALVSVVSEAIFRPTGLGVEDLARVTYEVIRAVEQHFARAQEQAVATSTEATMKFPPHRCGLYLEHNSHRDVYESLADKVSGEEGRLLIWASDEAQRRAIATDELWELQWYPNTPISFCCVAAPTLEECLALALEVAAGDPERHGEVKP